MLSALFSNRKSATAQPAPVVELAAPIVDVPDVRIDRSFICGDHVVVEGVLTSGTEVLIARDGSAPDAPVHVRYIEQPRASAAGDAPSSEPGFLAILPTVGGNLTLSTNAAKSNLLATLDPATLGAARAGDLAGLLDRHAERLGFLFATLWASKDLIKAMAQRLTNPPSSYMVANGFIEQARGVPGIGGMVLGWSICIHPAKLFLVSASGGFVTVDEASRWHRADVVDGFSNSYGNETLRAGTVQAWHGDLEIGEKLHLVVKDGDKVYSLADTQWEGAPVDPVSFARFAFSLPDAAAAFADRLEHHHGPILDRLIERKIKAEQQLTPIVRTFGKVPAHPICAIIVPLFGRFDFMMHQLLEFADDPYICEQCEIIYVIDDPRIATEVMASGSWLSESNRIGFRVVDGSVNRGYSGANNLGVSIATAPNILLLNSDIVPIASGWLPKMLESLRQKSDCGIVGARLLYPNGSLQHDGMEFVWSDKLQTFLNKHPGSGFEAAPATAEAVPCSAVTGACLLIARDLYLSVGGLHSGYLIGDFEDSDLCMKVRAKGRQILCRRDVSIVHLERQSFGAIGDGGFREQVVRYNAGLHARRWGDRIRQLVGKEQAP